MFSFKRWLLCAALAFSSRLQATPPLTTIEGVLFNADGTRFNGVVALSWQSFEASDASNVAEGATRLQITNGILYVQLVPSTNATLPPSTRCCTPAVAPPSSPKTWTVPPPGILPYRVRDVRVPAGTVTGFGPAAATIIQITDITGLPPALNVRPTSGPSFAIGWPR